MDKIILAGKRFSVQTFFDLWIVHILIANCHRNDFLNAYKVIYTELTLNTLSISHYANEHSKQT